MPDTAKFHSRCVTILIVIHDRELILKTPLFSFRSFVYATGMDVFRTDKAVREAQLSARYTASAAAMRRTAGLHLASAGLPENTISPRSIT
jgi:hypothetical protein